MANTIFRGLAFIRLSDDSSGGRNRPRGSGIHHLLIVRIFDEPSRGRHRPCARGSCRKSPSGSRIRILGEKPQVVLFRNLLIRSTQGRTNRENVDRISYCHSHARQRSSSGPRRECRLLSDGSRVLYREWPVKIVLAASSSWRSSAGTRTPTSIWPISSFQSQLT